MTEHKRPHDCPPTTDNPADQPHPPGDGKGCNDMPTSTPPTVDEPEKCPDTDCCCPPGPGTTANCLEDLIAAQAASMAAAEKAGKFKEDLGKLLDAAKKASQEYTRDKYDGLVTRWVDEDAAIVELIRRLVCVVPCWKCVIECHICPLINQIVIAERWLYKGGLPTTANNLYDLLNWQTRNKEAAERIFNRIKAVLDVWATPYKTIDAALAANKGWIKTAGDLLNTDPGKAVYDLFLKIIPLHLAIAPPSASKWTTNIEKKYTQFCGCDTGTPDDCCGPNVGMLSVRERITGPQPYLIDPNDYFTLICCLVQKRYAPARDELGKADAGVTTVQNQINKYKALIDGIKDFEKNARPTVPGQVDCCDYECDDKDEEKSPYQAR
ncbi:MAG TPA: hypothetical protein VGP77_05275 [Vicinamibacterales bacterium]|jgi:hypothetical protein|nr:hypothetical protein [Vicinamibacterales bacterium]